MSKIDKDSIYMKKEAIKEEIKVNLSGFLRAWLVGFLVLFQFSIIIILPYMLSSYTIYFYSFLEIFSIMVIIGLVNDNRSPSYKISWICIVLVFPISGHIMYALWGKRDATKKMEQKVLAKMRHGSQFLDKNEELLYEYCQVNPNKARLSKYMSREGFPIFKNNQVDYYSMGEDVFEAMFDDLRKAKKFILVEFFIVSEGKLWEEFHEILVNKVREGVEVRFLYDDFGAMLRTSKGFRKNLEKEGIHVRVFNPIHKYTDKLYMNYRTHQKIVVIDGNIGYTGGINLADEYANIISRFGVWKDNGVRITGEAVWGLTVVFLQMWEVTSKGEFFDYMKYKPDLSFLPNDVYCHVISDGPANNPNNPIENVYKQMINYAMDYLYITTPYLIIEADMKDALIQAAKSGIDVRIITPGIADKKYVKVLTNYNYGGLLKHGIRIYEYLPGFIHSKTILNEDCAVVGSINMDYRSFYMHYECGVWMSEKKIVDHIKNDFEQILTECREVTYQEWKLRPKRLKLYQPILNMFSTLM